MLRSELEDFIEFELGWPSINLLCHRILLPNIGKRKGRGLARIPSFPELIRMTIHTKTPWDSSMVGTKLC